MIILELIFRLKRFQVKYFQASCFSTTTAYLTTPLIVSCDCWLYSCINYLLSMNYSHVVVDCKTLESYFSSGITNYLYITLVRVEFLGKLQRCILDLHACASQYVSAEILSRVVATLLRLQRRTLHCQDNATTSRNQRSSYLSQQQAERCQFSAV